MKKMENIKNKQNDIPSSSRINNLVKIENSKKKSKKKKFEKNA